MTNNELKYKLEKITGLIENSIEKEIAHQALNYSDDCKKFFEDMQNEDMLSVFSDEFIYLVDNEEFFDNHYHQIEEIREEFETKKGKPYIIKGDLRRDISWFAFETTVHKMIKEFQLEI